MTPQHDLPRHLALDLDHAHELAIARDLAHDLASTLVRVFDPACNIAHDLDHAHELALALDLDLDLDVARALARDLDPAYALPPVLARDLDRILDPVLDLARTIARDLDHELTRARARAFALAAAGGNADAEEADAILTSARPPGRITCALLAVAVRQLPAREQARYGEEWKAESYDQPRLLRWSHSLRLVIVAQVTAQNLRWRPGSELERQRPW